MTTIGNSQASINYQDSGRSIIGVSAGQGLASAGRPGYVDPTGERGQLSKSGSQDRPRATAGRGIAGSQAPNCADPDTTFSPSVEIPMALSHSERGRMGAAKTNASLTASQRSENARKGHLAQAVRKVVDAAPDLTPEQVRVLRTVFNSLPSARKGGTRA